LLRGAGPVRIGQLDDEVTGADGRSHLDEALEVGRVVVGAETDQFGVEHPYAGFPKLAVEMTDQGRVREIRELGLVSGDPVEPEADVVVPGVGGDLDHPEWRCAYDRQIGEGELQGPVTRHGVSVP